MQRGARARPRHLVPLHGGRRRVGGRRRGLTGLFGGRRMDEQRLAVVRRALWVAASVLLVAASLGLAVHRDDGAGAAAGLRTGPGPAASGEESALAVSALRTTTTTA